MKNDHQYVLAFYRPHDGASLGQLPLGSVDWEPACAWARWSAVRRHEITPSEATSETVVPSWDAELGEPYVRGINIQLRSSQSGCETETTFPTTLFRHEASRYFNALLESGKLEVGQRCHYRTLALAKSADALPLPANRFVAEGIAPALPLEEGVLASFEQRSRVVGPSTAIDAPVFFPEHVLGQAETLTRQAGEVETGGILVGHLRGDASTPEVFAEVTALVPARNAQADATSLHFTPAVWDDVQSTLGLRNRGEIWLGWFHSHPVRHWCRDCAPEKQAVCSMSHDFFSEHDRKLHRSVFPAAYSVALVVNDTSSGLSHSLFGWRSGFLESRGFHILNASSAADTRTVVPETQEGRLHARGTS